MGQAGFLNWRNLVSPGGLRPYPAAPPLRRAGLAERHDPVRGERMRSTDPRAAVDKGRRAGPIRVLFCESGRDGGSVRQLRQLLTGLDRGRFAPGLIAYYEDHAARDLFAVPDLMCAVRLALVRPGVPDVIKYAGPFTVPTPFGAAYFLTASRLLARHRPDVVYLNNGPAAHLPMIAAARRHGIPIIAHLRSIFELRAAERRAIADIRLFFTLSEAGRQHYIAQGIDPQRIRVVYDSVPIEDNGSPAEALLPPGPVYAVLVASLNENKRPLLALQALVELGARCPDLKVVLIGDGPLRPALEQFIRTHRLEDRALLLGYRQDARALLSACHIGLLLSRREGWGNSVLEYMAARLPVIVTPLPHADELVERDVSGIVLPDATPQSLAAALRRLYDYPDLRRRMGEAGRRLVESDRFARATMVAAVAAGIEESVKR